MIRRLARWALSLLPILFVGCAGSYEHEEVTTNGQGPPTIRRVPDEAPPPPPPPQVIYQPASAPTGPTQKEIDQQRKIQDLEAKQKALQDEIQKLKSEQTTPAK